MDSILQPTTLSAQTPIQRRKLRKYLMAVWNAHRPELVLFSVQWLVIVLWSIYRWHRMALTLDFASYYQAAYLIAHGHLDPFSTLLGFPFYQNDFELIVWPLGFLLFLFRSSLTLLIVQAISVAAASAIALYWIRQVLVKKSLSSTRVQHLTMIAFLLLTLNPWIYWAISFDVHIEPIILPFAVLAAMTLWQGRLYPTLGWAVLILLGGNVTATYVVGIGLGGLYYRGHRRKISLLLIFVGLITVLAIEHMVPGGIKGGNIGATYSSIVSSSISHVSVVTLGIALLEHPMRGVKAVWLNRMNLYGGIAPEGILGLVALPVVGLAWVVLLENNLISGHLFSTPQSYQGLAIMPLMVVGTITVLSWISSRWDHYPFRKWLASGLIGLVGINAIFWAATWIPRLPHQWVRISASQAQILRHLKNDIPSDAEVVASNGFIGTFADRQWVYALWAIPNHTLPIHSRQIYFILSPFVGTDVLSPAISASVIAFVRALPHVQMIAHQDLVWAFVWHPSSTQKTLVLPNKATAVPAWMFATPNGVVVSATKPYLSSNGDRGYLLDHYYAREGPGTYHVAITVSTSVPMDIEVWNATGNLLLARRVFPAVAGIHTVSILFHNVVVFPSHTYHGWGPFQISPSTSSQNNLEIRVWVPEKGIVNLYSVQMQET